MSKRQRWMLASVAILVGTTAYADTDPPKARPEGAVWAVVPDFPFAGDDEDVAKKRRSLSGIACPPPAATARLCVAAFDEGGEVRYVIVDRDKLTPQADHIVLQDDNTELDAEGAARDGNTIYITGSHSPPRKKKPCNNPDSRHVYRFNVDGATGHMIAGAGGKPIPPEDAKNRLWDALAENGTMKPFVGDGLCLGDPDHAVNIEGLAAKSGVLYFGFREPAEDETAYIVTVRADDLFGPAKLTLGVHQFHVGSGRGIRDLLAVPDGILMLLGPDDDKKNNQPDPVSWRIAFWDDAKSQAGVIKPRLLAELDLKGLEPNACGDDKKKRGDLKPEAMTMLENGTDFYRLLILSDGMCNGGPMSFRVNK